MPKNRLPAGERRQLIIDKAAEVFAIRGVEGTRTRDIAEACGINEALLYRHFSSKADMYRTAMLSSFGKAVESWIELAGDQPNGLEALISILRAQLTMLSENPVLCQNMWHGVASTTHDPIMKELINEAFGKLHDSARELIRKGKEDGSIRAGIDDESVLIFLRGITWVFMMNKILSSGPGEVPEDIEILCETFHDGINANPKKS